jgi:hypothetical protein
MNDNRPALRHRLLAARPSYPRLSDVANRAILLTHGSNKRLKAGRERREATLTGHAFNTTGQAFS